MCLYTSKQQLQPKNSGGNRSDDNSPQGFQIQTCGHQEFKIKLLKQHLTENKMNISDRWQQ